MRLCFLFKRSWKGWSWLVRIGYWYIFNLILWSSHLDLILNSVFVSFECIAVHFVYKWKEFSHFWCFTIVQGRVADWFKLETHLAHCLWTALHWLCVFFFCVQPARTNQCKGHNTWSSEVNENGLLLCNLCSESHWKWVLDGTMLPVWPPIDCNVAWDFSHHFLV